ncbi:16S rRNA processing protein RimM [Malaciobacter molluscorum]|uniref:ribosome maturation factor RimM n=1 Tax=Malaciobacter molluscorum TaxID=1032072 RepID=UPI00100A3721|nr:ribosome maturation factor RimM [Malaciobacter molluscorum]RXJ95612.1 16S rRNA processing protein RimM [Malaciobacter molluscorum]
MSKDKIYVAKLGKTVGLKGDLKIHLDTDFPEQFKKGATFTTNKSLQLKVISFNISKSVIKFESYEDVDVAKKLTNQELFTNEDFTKENCSLENNEYFWFDIINCDVIEDDIVLGKIKDIHRYPVSDYLEIATDEKLIEKKLPKNFLIPYLPEVYILKVEIDNKKIFTKSCFEILENS